VRNVSFEGLKGKHVRYIVRWDS